MLFGTAWFCRISMNNPLQPRPPIIFFPHKPSLDSIPGEVCAFLFLLIQPTSMKKFSHTALWRMLSNSQAVIDDTEAETAPDAFCSELIDYCRHEKTPAERIRALRFTRCGLISITRKREYHGAGEKCACPNPEGKGTRCDRLRITPDRHGVETPGVVC